MQNLEFYSVSPMGTKSLESCVQTTWNKLPHLAPAFPAFEGRENSPAQDTPYFLNLKRGSPRIPCLESWRISKVREQFWSQTGPSGELGNPAGPLLHLPYALFWLEHGFSHGDKVNTVGHTESSHHNLDCQESQKQCLPNVLSASLLFSPGGRNPWR